MLVTVRDRPLFFSLFYFPAYWKIQPPEFSVEMSTGITPEGYPWIGSAEAEVEITENFQTTSVFSVIKCIGICAN